MRMPNELQQENQNTPSLSGGASGGLNLRDPKDQALLRQALKEWPGRWRGITEAKRDLYLEQLDKAIDDADALAEKPETREKAAAIRVSIVKTAVAIDSVQQRDDHKIMDAILGTGKGVVNVNTQVNATVNTDARTVIAQMIAEGKGEDLARLADKR